MTTNPWRFSYRIFVHLQGTKNDFTLFIGVVGVVAQELTLFVIVCDDFPLSFLDSLNDRGSFQSGLCVNCTACWYANLVDDRAA
jgi:hypothetical protein